MKVNLSLLEFCSFNYDSRYNNLWLKNKLENIKTKIIEKDFCGKIRFLNQKKNFNIIDIKALGNYHHFDKNEKNKLFEIIEVCYPNLYNDIFNISSEDKKIHEIKIIQFKINSRSRCVALINNEIMYTLLFDLKHYFYEFNKKTFDNNARQEKEEWDFKKYQEDIKKYILNNK